MAGGPPAARLVISEVMAVPPDGTAQATGEWVELRALEAGDLTGITLTDTDGEADFTFAGGTVQAGELVVIANGASAPAGLQEGAQVFLARKDWWTFDDRGDDLRVLASDGSVLDWITYGDGPAVDATPQGNAESAAPAPPPGLSVGRGGSGPVLLIPTPGSENREAALAGAAPIALEGVVQSNGLLGLVFCPRSTLPFEAYAWNIRVNRSSVRLGDLTVTPGGCMLAGRDLGEPVRKRIAAELGTTALTAVEWAVPSERFAVEAQLEDPRGTIAVSASLPAAASANRHVVWLVRPCPCLEGWTSSALEAAPAVGEARAVANVQVFRAGAEMASGLAALADNATGTLDVNAYLFTSTSFAASLTAAARRGVAVRLLLEPAPAGVSAQATALSNVSIENFAASAVWVRVFQTGAPHPARDHAKYVIADGRFVLISTENFVYAALGAGELNTGYAVQLESRELAGDLLAVFNWDFAEAHDLTKPPRAAAGEPRAADAGASASGSASLIVSPAASDAADAWVRAINGAGQRIQIEALAVDDETFGPASPIGSALRRAAARGVLVEALVASSAGGDTDGAGNENTAGLLLASVASTDRVAFRRDGRQVNSESRLHAKVLVADATVAIVGSHNLVVSAFASNREISLYLEDPVLALELGAFLEQDFAEGIALAAAPVALENGTTVGKAGAAVAQPAPGPPTFALLFAIGGGVILASFLGPLIGRRARRHRRPASRQSADVPSLVVERWPVEPSPGPEASGAPRPPELHAGEEAAVPPRGTPALPPTAFELFGGP